MLSWASLICSPNPTRKAETVEDPYVAEEETEAQRVYGPCTGHKRKGQDQKAGSLTPGPFSTKSIGAEETVRGSGWKGENSIRQLHLSLPLLPTPFSASGYHFLPG